MTTWRTLLFAFLLMWIHLNTSVRTNADDLKSNVDVIVIGCGRDTGLISEVDVTGPDLVPVTMHPPLEHVASDISKFSLLLNSKTYYGIKLSTTHCAVDASFTVLPGQPRHLTLKLSESVVLNDLDYSLAGTLPVEGLVVRLRNEHGVERSIVVDGRAYYVDNLRSGNYMLEISLAGGSVLVIPVTINRKKVLTVRNVNIEEFKNAAVLRSIVR